MTQRALPSPSSDVDYPPRPDLTSALATTDPGLISDALLGVEARKAYLEDFIRKGLDKMGAPLGGTGLSAAVELDLMEENRRVLSFRMAYAVKDKSPVPPLQQFSMLSRNVNADGTPSQGVMEIIGSVADEKARRNLQLWANQAGQALKFQSDIMAFEGQKGVSKSGTPEPSRAFDSVRAKLDSFRAAVKRDPEARASIRNDFLSSAKEDPRWSFIWDSFLERYKDRITFYDVTTTGQTPAERVRALEAEMKQIEDRIQSKKATDDDYDRIGPLTLDLERLTGRKR